MLRATILAAALAVVSAPASAQDGCFSIDRIAGHLEEQFGELPVGGGVPFAEDSYVAIYANARTGTWALVEADPAKGIACVTLHGDQFSIARRLLGDPA